MGGMSRTQVRNQKLEMCFLSPCSPWPGWPCHGNNCQKSYMSGIIHAHRPSLLCTMLPIMARSNAEGAMASFAPFNNQKGKQI